MHKQTGDCVDSRFPIWPVTEQNVLDKSEELDFSRQFVVDVINKIKNKFLPQSLTHNDIALVNTIYDELGDLVFIDFDDMGQGSRVFDVAYPLIHSFIDEKTGEFNSQNAQSFYTSYLGIIPLTDEERDVFVWMVIIWGLIIWL